MIQRKRLISSILMSIVIVFITWCSQEDQSYIVETVNGTKYIRSIRPQNEKNPVIHFKFKWKLGDIDSMDENYLFFVPNDIRGDPFGAVKLLYTNPIKMLYNIQ